MSILLFDVIMHVYNNETYLIVINIKYVYNSKTYLIVISIKYVYNNETYLIAINIFTWVFCYLMLLCASLEGWLYKN